jgi:general secretion pathway protein D
MRIVALVLVLLVSATAFAEGDLDESPYRCKQKTSEVEVTFKSELELKDLVTWAVGFTCKKFVIEPHAASISRKVMLIAPGKQSPAQAWDMFTTALSTIGLTVVPKGKLLVIMESATSRQQSLPIYGDELPGESEQVVRYIMRPAYAQTETLKQAVSVFKSDAGDIQAAGNLIVITDHASNVRDMAGIAKLVDVPGGGSDGVYAIPVHHADATKLVDKLATLLDVNAKAPSAKDAIAKDVTTTPTKLLVDDRTNTLLVAGSEAAFLRVKALVNRLDIALEVDGGASIHVYQLGSAIADELAKTLNDAITSQQQTGTEKGGALAAVQGPVKIISDKPTNKLIVVGSGRDFLAVREVIRELDVPRRQVYIEAMILEVLASNGMQFGTSSHTTYSNGSGNSVLVAGVQTPSLRSTSVSSLASQSGLIGGLLGKSLTGTAARLLGTSFPSYAVMFQALADSTTTNILSTMPIIVVDNELAKYKVGENVPYKKGVLPTSPTSTTTLSTNIERESLLLELEIKPHISTDDQVLLEVKQSSKDKGDDDAELGPTWTERGVETRVLVRDQQTIVIGGLMQMRDETIVSKVPLLGDVPVLGHLFKYTTKTKKKMNLLILLTPYIIKDNLDLEMIRSRKQREYDEFFSSRDSLEGKAYTPRIDYRRKRGLVEEINRAVQDVESETAARAALGGKHIEVTPGLVQPEESNDD